MKTRLCTPILAALLCATPLWGAALGEGRLYECIPAAEAPTIDGDLTDECWQKAPRSGEFVRVIQGPEDIQQCYLQAAYDDVNLYLAITCLEPNPEKIRAAVVTPDTSSVMGDDAVEIFLRPDLAAPKYYQLSANSLCTKYDGQAFDPSWNGQWTAAATVGGAAWYLELAVRFSSFGRYAVPGMTWGFNVCRDRQAGGDTEWSAWADTMGEGFHVPARFGTLIFGGQASGANRGLLIECARKAEASIALEAQISEGLALFETLGLDKVPEADRQAIEERVRKAQNSLQALQDFLGKQTVLDFETWAQVTQQMQAAAEALDEVAWDVRFAALLADD